MSATSSSESKEETQDGGKKRVRTKAPKTKGGCVTCKARHLKCDQTKPSCLRCLRFWGKCDGYAAPSPYIRSSSSSRTNELALAKSSQRLLPRPHPSKSSTQQLVPGPHPTRQRQQTPQRPQARLPLSKTPTHQAPFRSVNEHRYFHTFLTSTVSGLPGVFTSSLWETVILQACHDEEFVRDAVVAIGALSSCGRSLLDPSATRQANMITGTSHYRFALSHYGRAVQKMRISLSSETREGGKEKENEKEKGGADLRRALLACLLVICFEGLQGNYGQALTHAVAGNQLLRSWLERQIYPNPEKEGLVSPRPDVIEDELVLAFGRLDLQVMAYVDSRPASTHEVLMRKGNQTILSMPPRFQGVDEARKYWEVIQRRSSHFIAMTAAMSMQRGKEVTTIEFNLGTGEPAVRFHAESEIYGSLPIGTGMEREYGKYEREILRWFAAFTPFYRSIERSKDERSWTAASLLHLHAKTSEIMILSSLYGTESCLDQFLPEYKMMVGLAGQICRSGDFQMQKFKFDLGVVNPLRLVAKWCRDTTVRRQAIALLRESRVREGLYDGLIVASTQEWIMDLEEEGLVDGEIKEDMRWRFTGVRLDCLRRRADVEAERLGRNEDGTRDVRGTVITW